MLIRLVRNKYLSMAAACGLMRVAYTRQLIPLNVPAMLTAHFLVSLLVALGDGLPSQETLPKL